MGLLELHYSFGVGLFAVKVLLFEGGAVRMLYLARSPTFCESSHNDGNVEWSDTGVYCTQPSCFSAIYTI